MSSLSIPSGSAISPRRPDAFELVQPDQKIVSGAMRALVRALPSLWRGAAGFDGRQAAPVPRLFDPGMAFVRLIRVRESERRQRSRAFGVRDVDTFVGVEEKVAHLPGPLLLVYVDQGLELTQIKGVA
jgi:hypothetical protein